MEAFENLMTSYAAQKDKNEKIGEDVLKEGLRLTSDILCEIEAKSILKGRDYESPKNLLDDLCAYKYCSIEKGMKNMSYITAELGSIILQKLIEKHKMNEKPTIIQDEFSEDNKILCPCYCVCYKDLEELIDVLLQLKSANRIQVSCFVSAVIDLDLSVVILSALQKADLVPVSIYISHNENKKDVLHIFTNDLISHLGRTGFINGKHTSQKLCEESIQLLATFLRLGLSEDIAEPGPATSLLCNQSCHEFLEQFVTEMTNHVLPQDGNSVIGKHFMQLRERKWHVRETALQKYLLQCLQSATRSPLISPEQALSLQQHWFHAEVETTFNIYMKYLLTAMGEEEAHSGIVTMIKEESSSWQNILLFMTVYLTIFSNAAAVLKAYVDDCLARALTKQSHSLLACAFLVARQACFNSAIPSVRRVFPSYGVWFASAFGAEAGSVQTSTNAATFSFLMEFLTNLVPTDPPFCLRVHINKVPSAPVHCSHLLTDYVSLAKTRLKDLGEVTGSGLFGFEYTPEEDVAAALLHFEKSEGQISRVLLDSSMFRRTQFENQFLPALLVPEPLCEVHSTRQLLVQKLQVLGKIPQTMLQQYEKACHRITSQRSGWKLQSVSGTPLERWQAVLELLVSSIRDNGVDHTGALTEDGRAVMSAVGAQLEPVLHWIAEQSDPGNLQRKVVGRLLKACEFCFEPPKPVGVQKSPLWLCHLVTLLKSHSSLLRQFRGAVYRIACDVERKPHVTEVAAALAYILDFDKEDVSSLKPTISPNSEKLGEVIGRALQTIDEIGMLHSLAFSSYYLRLVDESCADMLPLPCFMPSLLRILIYLHERLLHSTHQKVLDICANSWIPSSSWTQLILESQLSLTEWLDLEAKINRSKDPVEVRHFYLCEWIMQHSSQSPAPELLAASITYSNKGNTVWGSEILQIIPSILPACNPNPTTTVPWLLETWTTISIRFSHQNILKCVQNLPPWLLLTNALSVTPTSISVNALTEFFKKHMDKMSEKGYLPLNIVCLVIGAVRASAPLRRGEMLSQIIDSCPAVHLSILMHGQKLWMQLVPSFTASCPVGCSLDRIMKMVTEDVNLEQVQTNLSWEVGLVRWSRGMPLPQVDDGSLFFHMVDLGEKLLTGSTGLPMVTQGPVLPSALPMAKLLVQEPLHCLKMVSDAFKEEPHSIPAAGITFTARVGLSLSTMGVMLSLNLDQLSSLHNDTAKVCYKILQQCLEWWNLVYQELDLCDSRIQEDSFVHWLVNRVQKLLECLQCK